MYKKLLILLSSSFLLLNFTFGSFPLIANAEANPMSDGFDYPIGKPDGRGYCVEGCYGLAFLERYDYMKDGIPEFHPGEDWNDDNSGLDFGGNRDDKGDPIYAISNGIIKFAKFGGNSWGYLVLIEHTLPTGEKYWSQYAHLASITENFHKKEGAPVFRGETIGYVGDYPYGYNTAHHLHFEIRKKYRRAEDFVANWSMERVLEYYVDPSDFIDSHRPLKSDPINLASSNTTYNSTTLAWNKPTFQNFDHYELYRSSTKGGTDIQTSRVDLLSGNAAAKNIEDLTFEDKSLAAETTYFYKLCAYNTSGFYVGTSEIEVRTLTSLKNLTNNKYSQEAPSISGKYITWFDKTLNQNYVVDPKLYVYDITTETTVKYDAKAAMSGFANYPKISGTKIAYQARSVTNQNYGDQNIYFFDVEKNGGSGVPITEISGDQVAPQIYNNIVVWEDDAGIYGKNTDIYYIDLSKGDGPHHLVIDPGFQRFPKIWEDKVVYADNPTGAPGNDKITIIDINTKEKNVVPGLYKYAVPSIHSGKVVWSSNYKTYYYDLNSKAVVVLDIDSLNLITREGKIIYQSYDATLGNFISIYNILTGTDDKVVTGLYGSEFDYEAGYLTFTNKGPNDVNLGYTDIFLIKTIY